MLQVQGIYTSHDQSNRKLGMDLPLEKERCKHEIKQKKGGSQWQLNDWNQI
jgi:hypothetical protein